MSSTLVVFDIGGVLVRIRHSWDEILNALGEAPLARTSPWRHVDYDPLTDYQDGTLDEDAYLSQVGGDLGLTPQRAREAHIAMLETDYVGALELIEDLRRAGVQTACLSNTNALHWVALADPQRHPAIAALDKRFASFEIRVNKPEPNSYRAVAESFPGVERKIFFDDNAGNVVAAINLGWEAHRIDPEGNPPAQMRRILIESGVL
ncbi:hypothetical protein EON82_00565 [bacterium]|nr:MAG: hypothetical protein EON82_00565 [bacterium]